MQLNFNSVETIPVLNASAAFKTDSGKVFKEDVDIVPTIIDKSLSYVPWGGDNNMLYHLIDLIESDETLNTCQMFNAEGCYGSGLQYNFYQGTQQIKLLDSHQIRQARICCILEINGMEVHL